jgi:hypothetical protein
MALRIKSSVVTEVNPSFFIYGTVILHSNIESDSKQRKLAMSAPISLSDGDTKWDQWNCNIASLTPNFFT